MNLIQIKAYAAIVGATFELHTFDGGQTIHMSGPGGTEAHYTYQWGDEARIWTRAVRWLNALPWPTEDDPRVEGAY